jgi:hypothetical protein
MWAFGPLVKSKTNPQASNETIRTQASHTPRPDDAPPGYCCSAMSVQVCVWVSSTGLWPSIRTNSCASCALPHRRPPSAARADREHRIRRAASHRHRIATATASPPPPHRHPAGLVTPPCLHSDPKGDCYVQPSSWKTNPRVFGPVNRCASRRHVDVGSRTGAIRSQTDCYRCQQQSSAETRIRQSHHVAPRVRLCACATASDVCAHTHTRISPAASMCSVTIRRGKKCSNALFSIKKQVQRLQSVDVIM